MKKMGFTKSRWLSFFGRSLSLALMFCFFAGIQSAEAQSKVVVTQYKKDDTTSVAEKLATCNGEPTSASVRFTDDGTNDGNYMDPDSPVHRRRDTTEFCPKDAWHRVKVVFTDFDLAAGDSLFAYDGNRVAVRANAFSMPPINGIMNTKAAAIGLGSGSGVGVPQFIVNPLRGGGSGWVEATCDPAVNPSGCITFVFETNGDNRKGKGWDAWVDCEKKTVKFSSIAVTDSKLKCTDPAFATKSITAPTVDLCGTTTATTLIGRVKNQHGETCFENLNLTPGAAFITNEDFAIGQYMVEFKIKADSSSEKTTSKMFSVQAPSLVCNDEIVVPMGSACMVVLTPDDVLEQPCDTIADTMYYNITITLGSGKDQVVKKTTGFDTGAPVVYPIVTADDIKKAKMSVCGGMATVKIERIYYGRTGTMSLATLCNNGKQSLSCSTTLRFNDVQNPWVSVTNVPDTLIACDTTGLDKLLGAKGVDNCDTDVPVTYTVVLEEKDPCFNEKGKPDTTTATVTFRAVDDCGNVGTATRTITMIRPDLDSVKFVAKTPNVKQECNEDKAIPMPGIKIGVWSNNMFSVRDTVELSTEKYICGYILVSNDEDIPSTDCGKKKYRYWDVLDWCDKVGPKRIDTTFIENTDTKAPLFTDTLAERIMVANLPFKYKTTTSIDIELDHFSCTFDVNKLSKPKATDNCDPNPTVSIDSIYRFEGGAKWPIAMSEWTKLNCDTFCVRWIAKDECHEQLKNDTLYQTVRINDVTKPSAACVDRLNVSISSESGAIINVRDVDAGSFDACGIDKREIRIKGSGAAWDTVVIIGCEFVHPDVQLEMRVTDKKGNQNICWLDLTVEDKINPFCDTLAPVTLHCDQVHTDELGASTDTNEDLKMSEGEYRPLTGTLLATYNSLFGDPVALKRCEDNLKTDKCGELEIEQEYQLLIWPCGELKAKRRYRSTDWSGNKSSWAVQNITVEYKANWKITFPADWEGECGDMAPADAIEIVNGPCDLLGFEVTADTFNIPGDACFKIERTYHVINWCKYVAGSDPIKLARVEGEHGFSEGLMVSSPGNEENGYWTYIQVLKVHDDVPPTVSIINPDDCITGVEFDAPPYGEEDQTPGVAPFECDEEKTWTAIAVDNCSSSVTWIGKLYDANTGALVKETKTNSISYIVSAGESYFAEFWAYDGCGNSAGDKAPAVKFRDCKKPTPYVLNGIAVEIMQTGMVQVWATDLDQGSFDNCTDQSKLDLRIYADFLGEQPTDLAGVMALGKVMTFDCDRIGTNVVYIYAIDEAGNFDFVQTYVIIQDNMNACGTGDINDGMVAGTIVNPNGENVESVTVSISGGMQESVTTGANGSFMFNATAGENYTVTPEKDINPLNGVSTFDLVLISKHILGITQFDSPYKYIAADVNKSGSITAFDMVQLRQLILNISSEFPSNDSWRFVDASYEFTTANPAAENFNEVYNINALSGNMENLDFVGVKVGDVNGSARANSLLGAESRTTNGALTISASDRFVEAGETVTVEFTAADIASTQGYQFTLNFAGQNAQLVEGVAKAANFNLAAAERGVIATSWNGEATADEALFALTFTASSNGLLSEMVSVSSDLTTAEAYNAAGETMDVNIEFTAATTAGFELTQNTPNPFNGETVIGFNLPIAGAATLNVMDAQGKVLKSIQGDYAKGYNTVTLKANDLGATGVLYYQLESADNVATKKMIIIE